MYEAFYGLRERPFNLTPDPRFLYLSEKHKEAFAHLLYGIKQRHGFVMVSGEIGTGKTTICRTLLNQLDEDTEVAFIFNPFLSPAELLRKINEDFGIDSRATTVKGLIDELNNYLLERSSQGKNCVLVIDEAQNLAPKVLEQVRLLSNLETETERLLQIVLIGQPELMQNLALDQLRQLNQRITARYHLKPLDRYETTQYVAHRLRVAGGRRKVHFTRSALKSLYRLSGGTPRVINAICDRALLIGYIQENRDISTAIVRRAAKEIKGDIPQLRRRAFFRQFIPKPSVITTVLILIVIGIVAEPIITRVLEERPPSDMTARDEPGANSNTALATTTTPRVEPAVNETPAPTEIRVTVSHEPEMIELADLLDNLDPDIARNGAVFGILQMWGRAPAEKYPKDMTEKAMAQFASDHGDLSYTSLSIALDDLIEIGLPAFAQVTADKRTLWVGLTAVNDDGTLEITTSPGGHKVKVTHEEFQQRYAGKAGVFWIDREPDSEPLGPDAEGEPVNVLQMQLRSLGLLNEITGKYDLDTYKAVLELQKQVGLPADGVAGELVRLVISSWMPGFGSPSLTPQSAYSRVALIHDRPKQETATDQEAATPPPTPVKPKPKAEESPKKPKEESQTAAEPVPNPEPISAVVSVPEEAIPGPVMASTTPENAAGPLPAETVQQSGSLVNLDDSIRSPGTSPDKVEISDLGPALVPSTRLVVKPDTDQEATGEKIEDRATKDSRSGANVFQRGKVTSPASGAPLVPRPRSKTTDPGAAGE